MANATDGILNRQDFDKDSLALAVLRAEGFRAPKYEAKWRGVLEQAFIEWFGTTSVSAGDYDAQS